MAKAQILVVEDDRIVADDIQNSLKNQGFAVSGIVSSAVEALNNVKENDPDLVLMDIVLKGEMDGIETAGRIRTRFNIPVVYLTAYADERLLESAKITEPFGYIIKPFEDRELNTAIKIALYKHKMENKLKESQEWLSTTLRSIGDAVIATDTKGYVTFMNPVAESLTGWNQEEAISKPLKEVFNIINEIAGKQVENLLTKIIREGIAAGLANLTTLIAKDGREIPIDDSGAPIRDEKGNIIGAVLIFRDISEKKQAEETLLKRTYELADRVKELNCLYSISKLVDQPGISLEEILKKTVYLIPPAWEYPDITCARIIFENREFKTDNFKATRWKQSADIKIYEKRIGAVDVYYLEEKPGLYEGPFLKEERSLIDAIVERLGEIIEGKRAEVQNETILQTAIDGFDITDNQGYFLKVNDAFCRMTGYSRDELLAMNIGDLEKNESPEEIAKHIQKVKDIGLDRFETRFGCKEGKIIDIDASVKYVPFEEGWFVAFVRDITKRKLIEAALKESEEKFRTIVETTPSFLLIYDAKGKAIYTSPNCEEITGYTQEELLGESIWWVHEDDMQRAKELYNRVFQKGERYRNFEYRAVKKNGEIRYFSSSWEPLRGKRGKFKGMIMQTIDVTERKWLEEELLKARKLESIGVLAGGIAHDFNNILTAILGNISLARMNIKPEGEIYDMLTEAERASMQARDLTQQLLTFSRGGAPVTKTASIAGVIKDTTQFSLSGSNVRCRYFLPDDLWPVEIDEGQISQVINNIILNAKQTMPEGGIIEVKAENMSVGVEHALPLKEGKYIEVSIKDQGIGISEEYLSKIFDPYFTTKQEGSGLGLTTAYSIVKNHDGYITAKSELGVGTTFHIYLPASTKEILKKEKVEEKPIVGKGKILVMDDEQMVRNIAGKILKSIGYEVAFARDGAEAIEVYRREKESDQPFDAVIMDLTIPGGMGGKEAIKKLLEIDPDVKAIVSSGYSNDPVMANYHEYGFRDVITKPYRIKDLSEILHNLLDN